MALSPSPRKKFTLGELVWVVENPGDAWPGRIEEPNHGEDIEPGQVSVFLFGKHLSKIVQENCLETYIMGKGYKKSLTDVDWRSAIEEARDAYYVQFNIHRDASRRRFTNIISYDESLLSCTVYSFWLGKKSRKPKSHKRESPLCKLPSPSPSEGQSSQSQNKVTPKAKRSCITPEKLSPVPRLQINPIIVKTPKTPTKSIQLIDENILQDETEQNVSVVGQRTKIYKRKKYKKGKSHSQNNSPSISNKKLNGVQSQPLNLEVANNIIYSPIPRSHSQTTRKNNFEKSNNLSFDCQSDNEIEISIKEIVDGLQNELLQGKMSKVSEFNSDNEVTIRNSNRTKLTPIVNSVSQVADTTSCQDNLKRNQIELALNNSDHNNSIQFEEIFGPPTTTVEVEVYSQLPEDSDLIVNITGENNLNVNTRVKPSHKQSKPRKSPRIKAIVDSPSLNNNSKTSVVDSTGMRCSERIRSSTYSPRFSETIENCDVTPEEPDMEYANSTTNKKPKPKTKKNDGKLPKTVSPTKSFPVAIQNQENFLKINTNKANSNRIANLNELYAPSYRPYTTICKKWQELVFSKHKRSELKLKNIPISLVFKSLEIEVKKAIYTNDNGVLYSVLKDIEYLISKLQPNQLKRPPSVVKYISIVSKCSDDIKLKLLAFKLGLEINTKFVSLVSYTSSNSRTIATQTETVTSESNSNRVEIEDSNPVLVIDTLNFDELCEHDLSTHNDEIIDHITHDNHSQFSCENNITAANNDKENYNIFSQGKFSSFQ